jgi:hypothetical protein
LIEYVILDLIASRIIVIIYTNIDRTMSTTSDLDLKAEAQPHNLNLFEKNTQKADLGATADSCSITTPMNVEIHEKSPSLKSKGSRFGVYLVAVAVIGAIAFGTVYLIGHSGADSSSASDIQLPLGFDIEATTKCKTSS